MALTLKQVKPFIYRCIKANIVPYMCSHAGLGKSTLARQIAKECNAEFIDVRLASDIDPIDMSGFPAIVEGKATYIQFDMFPTEDTPLPKGKAGWVLMLDELSSCPRSIQTAAFKIILDRMVGQKKLHPKVRIIAAGNLATSNAHVNSMSTALQSRMAHFEIVVSAPDWIDWARENQVDSRVISFIDWRKNLLHNFDPKHSDFTFPCPRTIVMLSDLIKGEEVTVEDAPLIESVVGKGFSTEFRTYLNYFSLIPKLTDILRDPLNTPVPDGAGMCYATSSMLCEELTKDNATVLMQYIIRLNIEFQLMCLKTACKRDIDLYDVPAIDDWVTNVAEKYV